MASKKNILFLVCFVSLLLALTVTLVASYRQLFKQYPRLIILALCLIILSQGLQYYILQSTMKDPAILSLVEAKNNSIREGLANGTIPKGVGFEEQIYDMKSILVSIIKSIGLYCLLFIVPLYTNLRKLPETPSPS